MTTSAAPRIDLDGIARRSIQRPVWLRVGQLIDGVSDQPRRDVDVIFDAHAIVSVGEAPGACEPDAILSDFTLLPCLIEAHAHLFLDGATVCFQQREDYLKESPAWLHARARAR